MDKDVERIINDAASNVACESKEEVSKEVLESMKKQLLGETNHSDESFIYRLYKSTLDEGEEVNVRTPNKK